MFENFKDTIKATSNEVRSPRLKEKAIGIGKFALAAGAMWVLPWASAEQVNRQILKNQMQEAISGDGFELGGVSVTDSNASNAMVRLKLGECTLSSNVTIDRSDQGDVSDVRNYFISAYSNHRIVRVQGDSINPIFTQNAVERPEVIQFEVESREDLVARVGENPCAEMHDINGN